MSIRSKVIIERNGQREKSLQSLASKIRDPKPEAYLDSLSMLKHLPCSFTEAERKDAIRLF